MPYSVFDTPTEREGGAQVRSSLSAAQDELFKGLSKDQKMEAAHIMMARFQDSMFEELTSADRKDLLSRFLSRLVDRLPD